jgi:hypothetical protein
VCARLCIERLRRHVQAARPGDRTHLLVNDYFREAMRVAERFEHTPPFAVFKGDVPDGAILERKAQQVIADDLHVRYVNQVRYVSHDAECRTAARPRPEPAMPGATRRATSARSSWSVCS